MSLFEYVVGTPLCLLFVYLTVRFATKAYFASKQEYNSKKHYYPVVETEELQAGKIDKIA